MSVDGLGRRPPDLSLVTSWIDRPREGGRERRKEEVEVSVDGLG